MPVTVSHALSATTPDDPLYEIKPSNWNSAHLMTLNAVGSEISGAFGNAGGVSFGYDGTNVTAQASAAPSPINFSAGTTSGNLGSVVFADSNGISFGLNGSTITGTVRTNYQSAGAYLTTARASTDAIGLNTAQSNVTWTANSSGLSLDARGYAGTGTAITGGSVTLNSAGISLNLPAYLTTARASNDAVGLNTAKTNVTWTVNSSGISFDAGAYLTTAMGSGDSTKFVQANAVFNGTNASGTIASNSWSVSVAAQTNQTMGLYAVSNTEGASSSSSFDARTLSVQGKGAVSVGFSNGSLVIDAPSAAAGNVTFSAGAASAGLASIVFSNLNGVSFGLNGSTITASAAGGGGVGIYASDGTFSTGSVTLSASGGAITINTAASKIGFSVPQTSSLVGVSGISVSSNGSTISVGLASINAFEPLPLLQSGSTTYAPVAGSWYLQPFDLPSPIAGGRLNMMVAHGSTASNFRASSANFATGTTGTLSITGSYERRIGIFSVGAGTNSTRLESVWQSNFPLSYTNVVQIASAAGPNMTISQSIVVSALTSIGSDGGTTFSTFGVNSNTSSGNSSMSSNGLTAGGTSVNNSISSQLMIPVPFNTTLGPGQYYMGFMFNSTIGTSATGAAIASTSPNGLSIVNQYALRGEDANTGARAWLQTAASSGSSPFPGHGVFTATSASAPATIAFSDLRSVALMPINYINWVNSSI